MAVADVERSMPTLALRTGVPGTVTVAVEELGGRPVVFARSQAGAHKGALDQRSGETLAHAAGLALKYRLPLVCVLASSGADVHEGVQALHGWGTAANAFAKASGVVPILMAITGPTVSGPALLLGMADIVVATEEDKFTLPVALALYATGQNATQYGLLLAGSVVVVIPVLAVFLLLQRFIMQGVAMTGIK